MLGAADHREPHSKCCVIVGLRSVPLVPTEQLLDLIDFSELTLNIYRFLIALRFKQE